MIVSRCLETPVKHDARVFDLASKTIHTSSVIGHFTVLCFVTWPCVGSEAGGDLVLIQTSLLFICKCKLVSIRTA